MKTPKTLFLAWQSRISCYWFTIGRLIFAVFPRPEVDEAGQYNLYFFSQVLWHLPGSSIERLARLGVGETLEFDREVQPLDDSPVLVLTPENGDLVGYCTRYLLAEIFELLRHNSNLEVQVERVNKPTTPFQFRLLCKLSVDALDGVCPFDGYQYQAARREAGSFGGSFTASCGIAEIVVKSV